MLSLDTTVRIPAHVFFTSVDGASFLLDTRANAYFALEEVGGRFWDLLEDGQPLAAIHARLLDEYEVEPAELKRDLLELLDDLLENGLVELVQA
ncbi:MAG: PqqD family protein [Chloroflexota bacterium]